MRFNLLYKWEQYISIVKLSPALVQSVTENEEQQQKMHVITKDQEGNPKFREWSDKVQQSDEFIFIIKGAILIRKRPRDQFRKTPTVLAEETKYQRQNRRGIRQNELQRIRLAVTTRRIRSTNRLSFQISRRYHFSFQAINKSKNDSKPSLSTCWPCKYKIKTLFTVWEKTIKSRTGVSS